MTGRLGPQIGERPKHRMGSRLQTKEIRPARRHTGTSSSSRALLVLQSISIVWSPPDLSTPNGEPFDSSLHALVSTRRRRYSAAKMKQCGSHIVMLFLSASKTFDGGEDPAQELGGGRNPHVLAMLFQPLRYQLFSLSVQSLRHLILTPKH